MANGCRRAGLSPRGKPSPAQHRQQRRFAGAVGAEDAEHFAGFEGEVERVDQRAGTGAEGELLGGQAHGRVGSSASFVSGVRMEDFC